MTSCVRRVWLHARQVSQVLELVPGEPRVQRLAGVLRGCEYDDGEGPESARSRYTMEMIRGEMQASDAELQKALVEYRILELDGYLRPLSLAYLTHILETLLTALVSQRFPLPPGWVPHRQLEWYVESELDMERGRGVVRQVMMWFGTVEGEVWRMDEKAIVREIGLGHLMRHKVRVHEGRSWPRILTGAGRAGADRRAGRTVADGGRRRVRTVGKSGAARGACGGKAATGAD